MFGCGFALIVEGMPPEESADLSVQVFSLALAVAIAMLFLSVWFAMKVQVRMSKYDSHSHKP